MERRSWKLPSGRFVAPCTGRLEKSTSVRQGEGVKGLGSSLSDYFDLMGQGHEELFASIQDVWEILPAIAGYLKKYRPKGSKGKILGNPVIGENVFLGEGTIVEPGAYIRGPAWIGKNCEIRHGAYLRENVITGDRCVLGNSSEFKNCLLLEGAHAPHFNYVGDSVLGRDVNLGAGVILSNYRLDGQVIRVSRAGSLVETGLRKFGAIIGDGASVGCNAVLNPGSLVAPKAKILPGTIWLGGRRKG
jgi:UDP-N-acetylglucosamine diphosphorylase / glucose-1-phosphate thymidylyltransferase / UDP-N-acetylgalactosamine diphosphorylase / glucosamine-1-phosphate N-acetyltransferase / galactosamine-1-phosphate N-acetyltransferase